MERNGKTDSKLHMEVKPKRRLRVGDPDFAPPDGGWGWLVVFACGFSNLSTFPMLQQFGIIFREKFAYLQISNSRMTTVINMNSAATACIGLLNGPVFRKFSYRQYALIGTSMVAISLFLTSFAESFWAYLFLYSILYGAGLGIAQSSNALALNTYFRLKRRIATGLSWTTTGLGPIVCPYIITFLMGKYGMEGTLGLFAAFAGNAVVCSLLLQPVHWHTKFKEDHSSSKPLIKVRSAKDIESGYFESKFSKRSRSRSLFSSQYFSNDDDRYSAGFDMVDPGTPMLIYANDGWYSRKSSVVGSRMSLASNKGNKSRLPSGQSSVAISKRPSYSNLADSRRKKQSQSKPIIQELAAEDCPTEKAPQDLESRRKKQPQSKPVIQEHAAEDCPTEKAPQDLESNRKKQSQSKPIIQELAAEDCPTEKAPQDLKDEEKKILSTIEPPIIYPNEKDVLKSAAQKLIRYKEEKQALKRKLEFEKHKLEDEDDLRKKKDEEEDEDLTKEYTFFQKLILFFDLTLLKDYVYVNLMLGITIANFAELNFSILTPFVLKEFQFENFQIASFMSLLGATDVVCRFIIPLLADKIGWQNRSFFLFGVCCMALGRIILVHTQSYEVSLFVALIIGFGKGLRTVFMALVIPSHVPLEKLPAASGLQLVTSGILFLSMGPVIGWIRDLVDNYVITLHLLNIMTYITAISWLLEKFITDRRKRSTKKVNTFT